MDRRPLNLNELSPLLRRYLSGDASYGLKHIAARGLVPLRPSDLVTLLYGLQFDPDQEIRETARGTVEALPDQVLFAALDSALNGMTLDFLAELFSSNLQIMTKIVLHRNVLDETIDLLAQTGSTEIVEIIARNQVRYLRNTLIIKSIHENPFTQPATMDYVLEFARRSRIDVDALLGLAAPKTKHAPTAAGTAAHRAGSVPERPPSGAEGAAVSAEGEGPEGDPEIPPIYYDGRESFTDAEMLQFNKWMTTQPPERLIKLAVHGNIAMAPLLCRTKHKEVAVAIMRNRRLEPAHWLRIASERGCNEELIKAMCASREMTQNYNLKVKLALNPKTPISNAIGFVRGMRLSDLKTVARSKGVPPALQNTAKSMMKMHGVSE